MRTAMSGRINLSMLIKPTPSNLKYTKIEVMRTATSGRITLSMLIKPTPSNLKYTKNRSDENSHI